MRVINHFMSSRASFIFLGSIWSVNKMFISSQILDFFGIPFSIFLIMDVNGRRILSKLHGHESGISTLFTWFSLTWFGRLSSLIKFWSSYSTILSLSYSLVDTSWYKMCHSWSTHFLRKSTWIDSSTTKAHFFEDSKCLGSLRVSTKMPSSLHESNFFVSSF